MNIFILQHIKVFVSLSTTLLSILQIQWHTITEVLYHLGRSPEQVLGHPMCLMAAQPCHKPAFVCTKEESAGPAQDPMLTQRHHGGHLESHLGLGRWERGITGLGGQRDGGLVGRLARGGVWATEPS